MLKFEAFSDLSNKDAPVRGCLHPPSNPWTNCLILTHAAGADCRSPLLRALADAFSFAGLTVLRCDLPFRQLRPHGPPPRGAAERDQEGLRAAVAAMRRLAAGRVFLGGHSYGGRKASLLAAAEPQLVDSLLLLSYSLHPPKKPAELRTKHFPALQVPALFVHGTRDGFGTISEMESALGLTPARTELLPITGAGHELLTKSNRETLIAEPCQYRIAALSRYIVYIIACARARCCDSSQMPLDRGRTNLIKVDEYKIGVAWFDGLHADYQVVLKWRKRVALILSYR